MFDGVDSGFQTSAKRVDSIGHGTTIESLRDKVQKLLCCRPRLPQLTLPPARGHSVDILSAYTVPNPPVNSVAATQLTVSTSGIVRCGYCVFLVVNLPSPWRCRVWLFWKSVQRPPAPRYRAAASVRECTCSLS
jgi:hypothetical protein